jgi:HPt (histidine-containing phosphotransfer) domain-containing protein
MSDETNESERFMPEVDVNDGLKRVMGKKKLFFSLLTRFNARKMAADLFEAIKQGDHKKVVESAHAIKGASGNLGLISLRNAMLEVETRGKAQQDCSDLVVRVTEILEKTERAVAELSAMGEA